jgi:N-dimethylarginine dimethylaminohydrolase
MLDEKTAVVEEHQTNVIRQLEAKGIDVCALPLQHSRTLGGGFHCITNDMYREGTLESYG